jgi:hypothetical protein
MAPYIYTERNGIYIIDLQKTVRKLEDAYSFVRDLSASGKSLLFVGTKKQAQDAIRDEATRCGHVLCQRPLAGRHDDQLQDHAHPHRPHASAQDHAGGRHLRHAAQEGSHEAPGRDRQAWRSTWAA